MYVLDQSGLASQGNIKVQGPSSNFQALHTDLRVSCGDQAFVNRFVILRPQVEECFSNSVYRGKCVVPHLPSPFNLVPWEKFIFHTLGLGSPINRLPVNFVPTIRLLSCLPQIYIVSGNSGPKKLRAQKCVFTFKVRHSGGLPLLWDGITSLTTNPLEWPWELPSIGGNDWGWCLDFPDTNFPSQVLTYHESAGVQPSDFLEAQSWAFLVLPMTPATTIATLPKGTGFTGHRKELECLVSGSASGQQLFGSAYKSLIASDVEQQAQGARDDVYASSGLVDASVLASIKRKRVQAICSLESVDILLEKRVVEMPFFTMRIRVTVRSHAELIELSIQAALREIGVQAETLPRLPIESVIAGAGAAALPNVASEVLRHARQSRAYFLEMLQLEKDVNGDVVQVSDMRSMES